MSQNLAIERLGIFGGSFDPPHQAHITLAARAIEQLHLDQLLVIPTGDAWHKTRNLTLAPHRLAMTRLAFADLPKVSVDSREIDRHGPTYTFDTLEEIAQDFPNAKLFLCIGGDQAQAFSTWHRWKDTFPSALPKGVCEYIQQHSLYKNDR